MPVLSAYGPSTTGQTLDPNGYDLVTALFNNLSCLFMYSVLE